MQPVTDRDDFLFPLVFHCAPAMHGLNFPAVIKRNGGCLVP